MSCDEATDQFDDSIDPRVQVELERLNVATDEINRLEVDLDECRNYFRQLLSESTSRIEACSKKLGHCIAKARPYYDARLKAKEALKETQKMAAKYERANSAHAAAKEMVFLAEEGLKAEGRTFDHAWQEMLNHATMRVNESEAERTVCEAEHKRTSQLYQISEIRVQTLQRTLKKAISKSRPYFELKIHYNQVLEEQKNKVKSLERQVSDTKLCYAETLRNLEQISDEIHQSRHSNKIKRQFKTGESSNNFSSNKVSKSASEESTMEPSLSKVTLTSGSSIPDTDVWSEDSTFSENDCSLTGVLQTDTESENNKLAAYYQLPNEDVREPNALASTSNSSKTEVHKSYFEGIGICSFPVETGVNINLSQPEICNSEWTEIKLNSFGENFSRVNEKAEDHVDENFHIPYAPLSNLKSETPENSVDPASEPTSEVKVVPEKSLTNWLNANIRQEKKVVSEKLEEEGAKSMTPRRIMNIRRQSLDALWNTATGEKMKEILSQSIIKLSIGPINEIKSEELKVPDEREVDNMEEIKPGSTYEAVRSNQFGLQFFLKKSKNENGQKFDERKTEPENKEVPPNQRGSLKEKFFTTKVPGPLEKTLTFLNADDDSASDTESLSSMDMLTDDQISALVLDQDLSELYQDVLQ